MRHGSHISQGDKRKSNINGLLKGLHWGTIDLYASIRHSVNQSLVDGSKRLLEIFDLDAMVLQRGVRDTIRSAVGDIQKSFVDTHAVFNKSLSLVAGHKKQNDLKKLGSFLAHFAKHESRVGDAKSDTDS